MKPQNKNKSKALKNKKKSKKRKNTLLIVSTFILGFLLAIYFINLFGNNEDYVPEYKSTTNASNDDLEINQEPIFKVFDTFLDFFPSLIVILIAINVINIVIRALRTSNIC